MGKVWNRPKNCKLWKLFDNCWRQLFTNFESKERTDFDFWIFCQPKFWNYCWRW